MGLFHDLFFGASSSNDDKPAAQQNEHEQDWREEEQARWADKLPDNWTAPKSDEAKAEQESDPYRDSAGNKIRPEVMVERVKTNLSSDMKELEVWAYIKNFSTFDIELAKVNIIGQHTELGHFLRAGEACEVRIYRGNTPTNDAYHTAEVQFKIMSSGDYFQANHYIKYHYETNENGNFYVPSELDLTRPVKDI